MRRRGRLGDERGAALVELVLLFPVFVLFVELIVLGGRVAATNADVQSAAREAARQASLASGPSAAATVIGPTVDAALATKGVACQSHITRFGPGTNYVQGGSVEVEVTCTVHLADLDALEAIPGSMTVTRSAVEPIERYRVVEP
jgi:Flp pilus assembly protein TadG